MWAVVVGVLLAGLAAAVTYYLRRGREAEVDLAQRDEALRLEKERADAMERAAEADRQERAREFDAKAAAVRTADDAARVLAEAFPGTPETP